MTPLFFYPFEQTGQTKPFPWLAEKSREAKSSNGQAGQTQPFSSFLGSRARLPERILRFTVAGQRQADRQIVGLTGSEQLGLIVKEDGVMTFELAACAEMLWQDKPIDWRASRLAEMGFGVGLWNWPDHDVDKLAKTGARFTIMNGYLDGRLADNEGADMLLASARQTAQIGKKLGVERLNLHGTGLGDGGLPLVRSEQETGRMWLKARDTLMRICDLAEQEGVVFCLENLNLMDHPGCPFGSTEAVLALVSCVNRPELRINLDLYHTQLGEGDLIRWCEKCLPFIGEIQVADNPGRCEPGTGEINYPAVARALAKWGYSGPVGLEAFAQGNPEDALAAFRDAFTV